MEKTTGNTSCLEVITGSVTCLLLLDTCLVL